MQKSVVHSNLKMSLMKGFGEAKTWVSGLKTTKQIFSNLDKELLSEQYSLYTIRFTGLKANKKDVVIT